MHTFTRLFALLLLVAGLTPLAQASHIQGGTLTYTALGGNQYRVVLNYFRDCSGINAPATATLECRNAAACNSYSTIVTAIMTRRGNPVFGNQYCATLSGICTQTGPANYEANTYEATMTLPPAATWVLSVTDCCRPSMANSNGSNFRFEAVLHNQIAAGGAMQTVTNTSAAASTLPAFFIPWKSLSILGNSAFDADGDSLAYSLVTPLENCGVSSAYTAYPGYQAGGSQTTIGGNQPCVVSSPWKPATYTATLPVNVTADTSGVCPSRTTSNPRFSFDPITGGLALEPAAYDAVAPSSAGLNKYAAVVQIRELRRLGGQWVEVGVTRRELFLTVYDCGTNILPRFAPTATLLMGTQQSVQPLNQIIPVVAGEPVVLDLVATDQNTGQVVLLNLNYNATPGAVLQNTGGGRARLTFTPPASLPSSIYRVAVTAEDNNCPLKGQETRTIAFRVSATVLGTRASRAATTVAAWPTPFADAVQFQLPTAGVKTLVVSDALGRFVTTLFTNATGAGRWQPGAGLAPGLYVARTADGSAVVRLLYRPE